MAVGLCDALTGVLLIIDPKSLLSLIWIGDPGAAAVYLRYIGVFVLGTGLTYFLPLLAKNYNEVTRYVWLQTSVIRLLVASFVILQVCLNALVPAWLIVASTDASIGLFQIYLIKRDKSK